MLRLNLKLKLRRVPGDNASLVAGLNKYKGRVKNLEKIARKVGLYKMTFQQELSLPNHKMKRLNFENELLRQMTKVVLDSAVWKDGFSAKYV